MFFCYILEKNFSQEKQISNSLIELKEMFDKLTDWFYIN